jgi:hypothetical protein
MLRHLGPDCCGLGPHEEQTSLEQTTKAQRGSTLSLTSFLDGVSSQRHAPGVLSPPPRKQKRLPWQRKPVAAPGPVWAGAGNLAPPQPGFDPRSVQTVQSHYTD